MNDSLLQAAQQRQNQLAKPRGALGMMEDLAIRAAVRQQCLMPKSTPAHCMIFAADHPVCTHQVSAYPSEATAAMVANLVSGGAAASVLCRLHQITQSIVDVGVDCPYEIPGIPAEVDYICCEQFKNKAGDLSQSKALDTDLYQDLIGHARSLVSNLQPQPLVLVLGEMGIGNTTAAAGLAAALLELDASQISGQGTGVDNAGLARKIAAIDRGLNHWRSEHDSSVESAVIHMGGREIASLIGAILEATERRMTILVDGFIVSVAALAAIRINPQVRDCCEFAHCSQEQGHRLVLDAMQADPILDLKMRLGEATGALAAYPLFQSALALHAEMETFSGAGVPDQQD